MTDIGKLEQITSEEATKLRDTGIQTIDALWARIGEDFDCGVDQVAEETGIEPERLLNLLAAQGLREAEKEGSWPRQHWLEVILIAGLVILVMLVLHAFGILA